MKEGLAGNVWRTEEEKRSGILGEERKRLEKHAYERLLVSGEQGTSVFENVTLSLSIGREYLQVSNGQGQEQKCVVGPKSLGKRECVVYSFGTAGAVTFEKKMQSLGCQVFAFDCTDQPKADWKFVFKKWCLGTKTKVRNVYTKGVENAEFFSLAEIMHSLDHAHISVLKMDIEGFEWKVMEEEILRFPPDRLPEQLLFELHTEKAPSKFVPPTLVKGKNSTVVQKLFLDLFNLGYRVFSKEINNGAPSCAEFALLKVR
jgi:hypothetical protein